MSIYFTFSYISVVYFQWENEIKYFSHISNRTSNIKIIAVPSNSHLFRFLSAWKKIKIAILLLLKEIHSDYIKTCEQNGPRSLLTPNPLMGEQRAESLQSPTLRHRSTRTRSTSTSLHQVLMRLTLIKMWKRFAFFLGGISKTRAT